MSTTEKKVTLYRSTNEATVYDAALHVSAMSKFDPTEGFTAEIIKFTTDTDLTVQQIAAALSKLARDKGVLVSILKADGTRRQGCYVLNEEVAVTIAETRGPANARGGGRRHRLVVAAILEIADNLGYGSPTIDTLRGATAEPKKGNES